MSDDTTEQQDTTEQPEDTGTPEAPEVARPEDTEQVDVQTDEPEPAEPSGNREAAKYRRQLRDTEAERDALVARVETMQRAEAERLAGTHIVKPAALWANGATLADVLDDDGNVDPDKVEAAAVEVSEALGVSRAVRGGLAPVIPQLGGEASPHMPDRMVQTIMGRDF